MATQSVTFLVNGQQVQIEPQYQDWTLVRYLREAMRLTGTKQSCDNEGTCGTCTVKIDGRARRSCIEKVSALNGTVIETIESLALKDGGIPHPIVQTVIEDGIFQCAYCAPGAVMAAKILLDENPSPSQTDITRALSPVICRCVGLNRMDKSIERAAAILRGEVESAWTDEDTENEYIALEKITGKLMYTDDLTFPDMLHGRALHAGVPHAKILKLDTSKAERMPGVHCVLSAKDVPGLNRYGLIFKDKPVFCTDVVRYPGDTLALVVAETPEQALAALREIEVEFEPLPLVTDPERALEPDSPVLHEYLREKYPETPNVLVHYPFRKGKGAEAFKEADVIVEGVYNVPFVDHAFMEIECSIGVPEEDGSISVYCGSQGPTKDLPQVAGAMGMEEDQIRIAHMMMGGGFGGKEDIAAQIEAALAAKVTGRPVKILWDRAESLLVHHKRHAMKMYYKMGAKKDGTLVATKATILGDTGAYASVGSAVLFRSASFSCGPYNWPNAEVDTYAIHTNNPPCGAFRGFGGTQAAFASEVTFQKLIDALGVDPLEFRRKNALDYGHITVTGDEITKDVTAGVKACLEAVREALMDAEIPELKADEKLGVGIAASYKNVGLGSGRPDGAGASISLQPDGKFLLRHGAADMGQGSNAAMQIIAARSLEVPRKFIRFHSGDTRYDPPGGMTTASRATFVTGNATLRASRALREELWGAISNEFGVDEENLKITQEGVFVDRSTGRSLISLVDLARGDQAFEKEVYYDPPPTAAPEPDGSKPDAHLHFAYCYSAQAAMVAVNEKTGAVRVLKLICANDAGSPISMSGVVGQIEGAAIQGLGYALSEKYLVEQGIPKTTKFRELGLLRLRDLPVIEPIVVDEPHPLGPYGAKGMAELALSPTAPAIINAIHDAVGIWLNEIPIEKGRVKAAIEAARGKGGSA